MNTQQKKPGEVKVLHAQVKLFNGILKQIPINEIIERKKLNLYKGLIQELYPYSEAVYLVFQDDDTV